MAALQKITAVHRDDRTSSAPRSSQHQPFGQTPQAVQMAGNEVNAGSASTRRSVRSSRQRAYKLGSAQRKINGMDRWMKFRGVFLRHRSPPLAAMDRVKISAWMCFKFSSRCPAERSLRRALYLSVQPARTAASSLEMLNGVHRISLVVRRVPFEYRA